VYKRQLLARSLVREETPRVGSLLVPLYDRDAGRFTRAVEMSQRVTHGAMLFDLIYLNADDLWRALPRR